MRKAFPEARADGFNHDDEDYEEVCAEGNIHVCRFAKFEGHKLHRSRHACGVGCENDLCGTKDGEGIVNEGFKGLGHASFHVRRGDISIVLTGLNIFHVAEEGLTDKGGVDCGDCLGKILRLAERIVLDLARGLDVPGWDIWRGGDGDVAVDHVDRDIEDARGECCGALYVRENVIRATVNETVGVVAGVVDGGNENHSAVIVECEDSGAKDCACGEGSPWPEYVRSVAWTILVNVLVLGQSGDCEIATFIVIAVNVRKIACFLNFVAVGLGYIDILAGGQRIC